MKTKFDMRLLGEDGNAFAIMGRFSKLAKRAGWTVEEVNEETARMMSGDYHNLLRVAMEWATEPWPDEEEEDEPLFFYPNGVAQ